MSLNSSTSISNKRLLGWGAGSAGWAYPVTALATAAALVTLIATTNWRVDPFNRLGRNQLGVYSSSERDAKPKMIREYTHDGLIIGSSRITYIDPLLVRRYTLFNAGFSSAMPEEILNFLHVFAIDQKLVILGLDFLMFNER